MDARIKSGHDERILCSHTPAFSRRDAPEVYWKRPALSTEGAGNAGRPMRPQPGV
jgi:hypothetical protein